MKKLTLAYFMMLGFLTGCANQTIVPLDDAAELLADRYPTDQKLPLIVKIPVANNTLSNFLLVAALDAGTESDMALMIRKTLDSGRNVAALCQNDLVLCSTLNRAIKGAQEPIKDGINIVIFGNSETCPSTKKLATDRGFNLDIIPYHQKTR